MSGVTAMAHPRTGKVHASTGAWFFPLTLCGIWITGGTEPDPDRDHEIECWTCARRVYADDYEVRDHHEPSDEERTDTLERMNRQPLGKED